MPTLVILGLVGLGGYFAFKKIKAEMGKLDREASDRSKADGDSIETLHFDRKSGTYKPKRDD